MSGAFLERLRAARAAGDVPALIEAVPFVTFLGIGLSRGAGGEIVATLRPSPHVVGNPTIPALHGGAIASLLEMAAIAVVLWEQEPEVLPRPVTLTYDYLRSARPAELSATARIVRRGRRVCTVRAEAWQEDRARPVAAANATLLLV